MTTAADTATEPDHHAAAAARPGPGAPAGSASGARGAARRRDRAPRIGTPRRCAPRSTASCSIPSRVGRPGRPSDLRGLPGAGRLPGPPARPRRTLRDLGWAQRTRTPPRDARRPRSAGRGPAAWRPAQQAGPAVTTPSSVPGTRGIRRGSAPPPGGTPRRRDRAGDHAAHRPRHGRGARPRPGPAPPSPTAPASPRPEPNSPPPRGGITPAGRPPPPGPVAPGVAAPARAPRLLPRSSRPPKRCRAASRTRTTSPPPDGPAPPTATHPSPRHPSPARSPCTARSLTSSPARPQAPELDPAAITTLAAGSHAAGPRPPARTARGSGSLRVAAVSLVISGHATRGQTARRSGCPLSTSRTGWRATSSGCRCSSPPRKAPDELRATGGRMGEQPGGTHRDASRRAGRLDRGRARRVDDLGPCPALVARV